MQLEMTREDAHRYVLAEWERELEASDNHSDRAVFALRMAQAIRFKTKGEDPYQVIMGWLNRGRRF